MIEKILERLEAERNEAKLPDGDYFLGKYIAYDDAMKIVQEVAKEYDWIPVSERLPEPFQRVLVYDSWDDSMTIEHLQENDSFIDSVVAWMPLPIAPYQKEPSRCDTCTHYVADEVPPICYFCCKGMEDNYKAREEEA